MRTVCLVWRPQLNYTAGVSHSREDSALWAGGGGAEQGGQGTGLPQSNRQNTGRVGRIVLGLGVPGSTFRLPLPRGIPQGLCQASWVLLDAPSPFNPPRFLSNALFWA